MILLMKIILPPVRKQVYANFGNIIWHEVKSNSEIDNCVILSQEPFIIKSNEDKFFLTAREEHEIPVDCDFALLTNRKPSKKDFESQTLEFKIWLKHPAFIEITPQDVTNSWKDNFKFIQEDVENGIEGLRPAQTGAIYSILAHIQNPEDRAIVVMPTGTGKTEVMLSSLISIPVKNFL